MPCGAESAVCQDDSTCNACLVVANDALNGCYAETDGYDSDTATCAGLKEFTCCQYEGIASCQSNALLGAYYGASWVPSLLRQHDRLKSMWFVFSGGGLDVLGLASSVRGNLV